MVDAVFMRGKLKGKNVRLTPQRLEILNFLMKAKEHPSAEKIYREVRKNFPTISKATVYNSLLWLKRMGMVIEVASLGDVRHFDGMVDGHHHLLCVGCHCIIDVCHVGEEHIKKIKREVARKTGCVIHESSLTFYGICSRCNGNKKARNTVNREVADGACI